MSSPICNKDCGHCPYPDCINETMDAEDYREAAKRDRQLGASKGSAKTPHEYYLENREEIIRKSKEYYYANREACLQYHREYRERTREMRLARQRAYDKERRRRAGRRIDGIKKPPIDRASTAIVYARAKRGMSQKVLAQAVGYTACTITQYEYGRVKKPDYDSLIRVMPELEQLMGQDCRSYCDRADSCDLTDCWYRHLIFNKQRP